MSREEQSRDMEVVVNGKPNLEKLAVALNEIFTKIDVEKEDNRLKQAG
ncbi:hypothetical protein [Pseudalkalibacillus hwajinpoensis]|nr:hypothetical protein [Pseudalkalibacillus hwajinpoensis]